MKELRGRTDKSLLQVLYAFDPRRTAILLIGGDKKGSPQWYEEFVPIADQLFDEHLSALEKETRKKKGPWFMAKNFAVLRTKLSPGARERAHRLAEKYEAEMALAELRVARQMTQEHLAQLLGVNQAAVSKMERRTDMYISTLQSIIRAMGGELKIQVVFPEGKVEINQFRRLKAAAGR
jgi:DNA-binding XRE family transcriptional regulator